MAVVRTLRYRPDQSSYGAQNLVQFVLEAILDGGGPALRRDIVSGCKIVDCQWTLSDSDFKEFDNFYRVVSVFNVEGFYAPLILDRDSVELYPAFFDPDPNSYRVSGINAKIITVNAKLLVKMPNYDEEYDDSWELVWDLYGPDRQDIIDNFLNPLHKLVNIDLPKGTGIVS